MQKLTNFIHESNKKDFTKKVEITLENGIVLEAKFTVSDVNEKSATDKINESILNKNIKSLSIKDIATSITESVSTENVITEAEYYIPFSNMFNNEIQYTQNTSQVLENRTEVASFHREKQYGWETEPSILVAKIQSNDIEKTVESIQEQLKYAVGSPYIRLAKKDW